MYKKQALLFLIPLFVIASAFASHETSFNLHLQDFDLATNQTYSSQTIDLDLFSTATCSGTPIFTSSCTTDVNGVCDINITMNTTYNQIMYACIGVNNTLLSGSPYPFRAGFGQIDEFDVDFTNLNITNDLIVGGTIYGDGSGLTNITADDLDINDNEWLYLDTADTIGLRYNTSGSNIEMNYRLYVPNIITANSIDAQLGYFNYLQMGYKGFSTGNPFTVINTTGTPKLSMDFSGNINFLDPLENNYISWNESSIGEWNYGSFKGLELYAGGNGVIYLYNPTEVTGNLTVAGNVTGDYFVGDGSLLTNLPSSPQYWNLTGNTLEPAILGNKIYSTGNLTLKEYNRLCLDSSESVCFFYNSSYGYIDSGNNAWKYASLNVEEIQLRDSIGNKADIWFNGTNFEFYNNTVTYGNVTADYFIGDGSQLTNLPISAQYWNRTGTTLYPATAGDDIAIPSDNTIDLNYGGSFNGIRYNSTSGFIQFDGSKLYSNNMDFLFNDGYGIEFEPNGDILWYDSGNNRFEFTDDIYTSENYIVDDDKAIIFGQEGNITADYSINGAIEINAIQTNFMSGGAGTVYMDNILAIDGQFDMLKDNPIIWTNDKTLTYNSTTSRFEFNDKLYVNGQIQSGSLYPLTTETYDVGNNTLRWNNTNTKNAFIGNSTGNTTVKPDGTTFSGTAQPIDFIEFESFLTGASAPLTTLSSTIGVVRGFDDGTDEQLYTHIKIPTRFSGGNVTLKYTWFSPTATTGAVVWGAEYRLYKDGELQNVATSTLTETQTTQPATYTRITTNGLVIQNAEAGDTLELRVFRDANAGADTMTGDAYFTHATLEFPIYRI